MDAILKVDTPFGPCWHRYNHDEYGQRPDGGPYQGWGRGRAWPLLTGERGHYELAAGRSVTAYIHAMEGFASIGGMLPEQISDEADRPDFGIFVGRPVGSAMPLMWAHAEYIKLLRSVADGQVFDLIPAVAERYLRRRGRKDLEIWKPIRRVRHVRRGQTLRIQAPASFLLHWTADEWQTFHDTSSSPTGLDIYFADLPIDRERTAPIRFTLFWEIDQRWEGQNYEISIQR